jgi:ketosteroid isomerase-like protein
MSGQNTALVRRGYEAVMRGDLDQLEQLLDPNLTWHWWEHGPWDCENRGQAMAVIRERLGQRAIGELREVVELDAERVLVVIGLAADSEITAEDLGLPPAQDEMANLVTIRGGRFVAMHDYRSKAEALEAAGIDRRG